MRKINRCLNNQITKLCQHALKIEAINEIVQPLLPESVKGHCHVGSFTNSCLKLVIDNPNWATELRYCLPEIRDTLRREAKLYQLSSIKLEVAVPNEPIKKGRVRSVKLSDVAKQTIQSEANHIDDLALKEALLKLARLDEDGE